MAGWWDNVKNSASEFTAKFTEPELSNKTKRVHHRLNFKDGVNTMVDRARGAATLGESGGSAGRKAGGVIDNAYTKVSETLLNGSSWVMKNRFFGTVLLVGLVYAIGKGIQNIANRYFLKNKVKEHNQATEILHTEADTARLQAAEAYMAEGYGQQTGPAEGRGSHYWRDRAGREEPAAGYQPTYH